MRVARLRVPSGLIVAAILLFGAELRADDGAPPPPTLLVTPLDAKSTLSDIGYALGLRLLEILRVAGDANLVHPKMLARVEARYDHRLRSLTPERRRRRLGRILGASHVLHGTLDDRTGRLELRVRPVGAGEEHAATIEGADFESLLEQLAPATVKLLKSAGVMPEATVPEAGMSAYTTRYRQAMLDHASCHRSLMAQPMGIGPPIVVDEPAIRIAMDGCQVALERDDLFAAAKADLALAYAFLGDRKAAERILIEMKDTPGFHPTYWLARFWVLSRYYDVELGLENLREAIRRHPGFMLGRGYLGEALLALNRPEEAREVFETYLARCPRQSYVMGRIGLCLERSGAASPAIDWAERALLETPEDQELLVQKGDRLLAARHPEAAIALYESVVGRGAARASVHARLARAQLAAGRFDEVEGSLRQAILRATGPEGWRTRNQARYALARLWMRASSPENAIRQLRRSLLEGFVDRAALRDPPLSRLRKHPDFKRLRRVRASPGVRPIYVSPLGRVDEAGRLVVRSRFERRTDRKVLERL